MKNKLELSEIYAWHIVQVFACNDPISCFNLLMWQKNFGSASMMDVDGFVSMAKILGKAGERIGCMICGVMEYAKSTVNGRKLALDFFKNADKAPCIKSPEYPMLSENELYTKFALAESYNELGHKWGDKNLAISYYKQCIDFDLVNNEMMPNFAEVLGDAFIAYCEGQKKHLERVDNVSLGGAVRPMSKMADRLLYREFSGPTSISVVNVSRKKAGKIWDSFNIKGKRGR